MEAALTVPAPTIARSRTTPPRTRRIAVLGADRSGGSRLSRLLALHPQLEPVDDPWTGGPGAWHRAAPEACVVLLEGDEARAAIAACRERDLPVIDLSGALDALGGPASETTRSGAPPLLAEVDPSARYVSLPPLRAAAVALTAGPLAMAGLFDPGATICVVASGPPSGDLPSDAARAQQLIDGLSRSPTPPSVLLVSRHREPGTSFRTRVRVDRLPTADAEALYRECYRTTPTVRLVTDLEAGPSIRGTHVAHLSLEEDTSGLWLECALDGEGWLDGQVLEALNRLLGQPPSLGLRLTPDTASPPRPRPDL